MGWDGMIDSSIDINCLLDWNLRYTICTWLINILSDIYIYTQLTTCKAYIPKLGSLFFFLFILMHVREVYYIPLSMGSNHF
ncbi:hypothetical protein F4775DRAFT_561625 [Biscogniauxia sp. FL1348]|nr:hypothetical protein F4775DRAFT_561625 [Biscogniauxia sp. FL1348]